MGKKTGPKAKDVMERFWPKVHKTDTCWLWIAAKDSKGYGKIVIGSRTDGTRRYASAHRISYIYHFMGPIDDGLGVLHTCDNPACVNPEHLFLGDQQANVDDMIRKGRQATGDKVANRGPKNGFYGRKHTEESKIKMRKPKNRIHQ